MICEFTLPSNPEVIVRLREATVADAIDFSSIDPECEEEATSLFLERVQEKENFSNPRDWTGEDRRYALFMYFIHTTTYKTIPMTYTCSICGKQHTQDISLAEIMNDYTPIKDQAFREFPWRGHNVVVRPMIGSDLEDAEKYRYELLLAEREFEARREKLDASEVHRQQDMFRAKRVRMAMFRVLCCIDLPYLDPKGTPRSPQVAAPASASTAAALPAAPVAVTKSQQASAADREERAAERQGGVIAEAVAGGLGKLGTWGKSGVDAVRDDSDARDAAGYAIAGPLYGVAKELREALPDSMKDRLESRKERGDAGNQGKDENGKKRDAKGRFLPDRDTVRRETARIEIAEDELALQEREAKIGEKRNKELVRAIRASGGKGLLDRFAEGRRGRDRVIRERGGRGAGRCPWRERGAWRGRGHGGHCQEHLCAGRRHCHGGP